MIEERKAAERLVAILGRSQDYLQVYAVIDAVENLNLTAEECTTDVLRALWPIAEEFLSESWGHAADHWAGRLFEYVEELLDQP